MTIEFDICEYCKDCKYSEELTDTDPEGYIWCNFYNVEEFETYVCPQWEEKK
jgi:hypothetical protein